MEHHIRYDEKQQALVLLDQRLLPATEAYFTCRTSKDVITALQAMVVRGAPAIGVVAAWGCVLAAWEVCRDTSSGLLGGDLAHPVPRPSAPALREVPNFAFLQNCPGQDRKSPAPSPKAVPSSSDAKLSDYQEPDWALQLDALLGALQKARPTAINLAWAVERMRRLWKKTDNPTEILRLWQDEAHRVQAEDIATNKRMGVYGAELIEAGDAVMTYCNAGALATAGFGTALGVIYAAHAQGKGITVIANETRPVLQGARLSAYELQSAGVPVTVVCDNACALLMRRGMVQKVVVGADRIAANGDTANKIGTYGVALLARAHGIPFYVAAPLSTIDRQVQSGEDIPIEERAAKEVTNIGATVITPAGVPVLNFAFDVTPGDLIAGIITERGVLRPPYADSIRHVFDQAKQEQSV